MPTELTEEPDDIRGLIEIQGQKNDILRSTIQQVSPKIEQSFDELCGSELEEIDQLYSTAALVTLAGFRKAGKDGWQLGNDLGLLLYHTGLGLSAAAQLLRHGYPLSVGVVARNALEMIATVLHLHEYPDDLQKFREGRFGSTKAVASSAKKLFPWFGELNGLLSNEFVHVGEQYNEMQTFRPYKSRDDVSLGHGLTILKIEVWMFYVTVERTFYRFVRQPMYWVEEPSDSEGQIRLQYAPTSEGDRWAKDFIGSSLKTVSSVSPSNSSA
jgi:hypothetical protein